MNGENGKTRGGGAPGRIVTRNEGDVFVIGIDRPEKFNGFSPNMFDDLAAAYQAYEDDGDTRCALLYGEGKHFAAGADLNLVDLDFKIFPDGVVNPCNMGPIRRSKPLVVAVQGVCFTIGVELMLAADIVVAAADTRFGQIEVSRGVLPFAGGTFQMVERAGWGNAMRYLLTGDEFNAETAHRMGFVQEVVAPGEQYGKAMEIAERIAAQAPLAVQATMASGRTAMLEGIPAAAAELPATVTRLSASASRATLTSAWGTAVLMALVTALTQPWQDMPPTR